VVEAPRLSLCPLVASRTRHVRVGVNKLRRLQHDGFVSALVLTSCRSILQPITFVYLAFCTPGVTNVAAVPSRAKTSWLQHILALQLHYINHPPTRSFSPSSNKALLPVLRGKPAGSLLLLFFPCHGHLSTVDARPWPLVAYPTSTITSTLRITLLVARRSLTTLRPCIQRYLSLQLSAAYSKSLITRRALSGSSEATCRSDYAFAPEHSIQALAPKILSLSPPCALNLQTTVTGFTLLPSYHDTTFRALENLPYPPAQFYLPLR
jgi:hypothetical protein